MDAVFKALADASRRELLDRLRADNGQTLDESYARLDMTRQAVSKHLAILEANLVATVWRGRQLHYLNPVPIHEIGERWIGNSKRGRLQALSDMKALEEDRRVTMGKPSSLCASPTFVPRRKVVGGATDLKRQEILVRHDGRMRLKPGSPAPGV
jgi:DNA-binding transcriptional ArsR family regulator